MKLGSFDIEGCGACQRRPLCVGFRSGRCILRPLQALGQLREILTAPEGEDLNSSEEPEPIVGTIPAGLCKSAELAGRVLLREVLR